MCKNQPFGLVLDLFVSCLLASQKGSILGLQLFFFFFFYICGPFLCYVLWIIRRFFLWLLFQHLLCYLTIGNSIFGFFFYLKFCSSKVYFYFFYDCILSYDRGNELTTCMCSETQKLTSKGVMPNWKKMTFYILLNCFFLLWILRCQRRKSCSLENLPWHWK